MLRVALKGVAARKLRLFLTSIAIVLGVAFMTGTFVLSDTITRTFDNLVLTVNHGLAAEVRGPAQFKDRQGNQQRNRIDASLLSIVRSVPGVRDAEVSVSGFGIIVDKHGKGLNAQGNGPPPLAFAWNPSPVLSPIHLVAGGPPLAADEVVIDKRSADRAHFHVGDRVRVVTVASRGTSALYRIAGIGKFGSADSAAGASLVFFTAPVAEALLASPGKVDAIDVAAQSGVSSDTLVKRIGDALHGHRGVEVVAGSTVVHEQQNNFQNLAKFFKVFLLIFAIVALVVGSFVIYNTFSITVAQRLRENALLRAIGVSRLQVTTLILVEAFLTGLVASLLGLGAGILLASGLKGLLALLGVDIPAGGTVLASRTIIVSLLVGTLVTVVASLMPALRASRVPPVAAMRDVATEAPTAGRRRIVAGVLVIALGVASLLRGLFGTGAGRGLQVATGALVVFVGVTILGPLVARQAAAVIGAPLPALRGLRGVLARENAMRNPRRTASTASALMIGVGLVGFVTIFAASAKASVNHVIDSEMKADYIVNTSGFGSALPPRIETEIRAVPGVRAAAGLRVGSMKIAGSVKQVEAVDTPTIDQFFDVGVVKGSLADLRDDGLAIFDDVARTKHWKIGTRVPVQYAKTGAAFLTVRAIYNEQALAGPYVISLANYERNFADQSDAIVMVTTEPGRAVAARPGIERVLARYPNGKLQNRSEFKAAQAKQINQLLNLIYALLMMAIIIAVVGIANTLALSIFERTREIGLLRAVGLSRAQVRSVVRWEAVIIALFGTLLGLAIGVFFGWVLVRALADQGIDRLSLPPGQLLVLVVLGAGVGTLAAIWPARRAARLDMLRAIASE